MKTHTVKTVSIETELTCEQIVKAVNGYNDLIIAIKTGLPAVTDLIEDIELAENFIEDGGKNEALQILDRVKEALLKQKGASK